MTIELMAYGVFDTWNYLTSVPKAFVKYPNKGSSSFFKVPFFLCYA